MDRVTGVACEGGGWIDTIVVNCNDINRKRDTWRGVSAALTARNWRKSWKIPQVYYSKTESPNYYCNSKI